MDSLRDAYKCVVNKCEAPPGIDVDRSVVISAGS